MPRIREGRRLHHDCGQLIDAAHDFGKLPEHRLEFFHASVQRRGAFKFQTGRGLLALRAYLPHQGVAAAVEVGLHPGHLGVVVLVGAALEAGRETHFHLGVDAAGKLRVGMEIVHAAPHLEEIERVVGEFFRGRTRWERPVVKRAPAQTSQPGGDRSARVFIFHVQLEQRGEAQAEAVGVGLGEGLAQHAIQEKAGFEIGTGGGVLDGAHAVAQVQSSRLFRRAQEAVQAAAQIGGLADIGFGLRIVPAQQEYCRRGRGCCECFRVAIGDELKMLAQHKGILV